MTNVKLMLINGNTDTIYHKSLYLIIWINCPNANPTNLKSIWSRSEHRENDINEQREYREMTTRNSIRRT